MDRQLIDKKYIFGSLFLLANKLQIKGDQLFEDDGMTLRQWFLTVMILQFKDCPPTLGEVASLLGTSYQNTKEIAKKLEKKQFLKFVKDEKDRRMIRLQLTVQGCEYWNKREKDGDQFINKLFKDLNSEEIQSMVSGINKMLHTLENWD